jgi:hypothetical protein
VSNRRLEEGQLASSLSSPHFALDILAKRSIKSLIVYGWIVDQPYHVVLTSPQDCMRGSVVGPYFLQTTSKETLSVLKKMLVELTWVDRIKNSDVCRKAHR